MAPMNALLIVDDHPVYRDALHQYLSKKFLLNGIQVLSSPSIKDGVSVIESLDRSWTVLLDLSIPDSRDYLDGISQFKKIPKVQDIVAISGLDEEIWGDKCIDAGCAFFISKNNESIFIFEKLKTLISGNDVVDLENKLTNRQHQILEHIAKGQSNKVIAYTLNIREQTVKIHINEIFKKLKVFNRTQAVLRAQEIGLL